MPSSLRYSTSPSTTPVISSESTYAQPPQKKQKMSLTQTYYLAHSARAKLSKEAARADHNLHRLVGHANLLDSLMLDLAEAEREQESWFNQTVTKAAEPSKHIQWSENLPQLDEEDEEEDEYSWDDSDIEEEVSGSMSVPLRIAPSAPATVTTMELNSDEYDSDDYEDDEELALTRSPSRTPPELLHESDSDSEDDSLPPSPQAEIVLDPYSEKQRQAASTKTFFQPTATIASAVEDADLYASESFIHPAIEAY
ncbi:hypothetical protein MMC25_000306 [Agyrium rufum]|nr:hypothetical protein [Agyrium rufum]